MKENFTKIRMVSLLFLALWLATSRADAQETVSVLKGRIVDEQVNEPLVGALVVIKGTKDATYSDISGEYEIRTKEEFPFTVVVSYFGYGTKEIEVFEEQTGFEIFLRPDNVLSEVVVTAAGIKNERKALGYSVTEVKGDELVKAREPNIVQSLSGKVAGVQISNGGGSPGGASNIRIRGSASILGNNAPLFIVDGIPVDNATQDILGNISNAFSLATPSNRGVDINSDDVENLTVLKGPAAAALYGIRAANGAVIITTKRGSRITDKKLTVEFSNSLTVDQLNRRLQPRQKRYSNGLNGQYIQPGQPGSDENWGAPIESLTYSNLPSQFDRNGQIVDRNDPNSNGVPLNNYDNEKNFFVNGVTQNYYLGIYGNTDKAGYYASLGRLYQTGVIPTTDFYRTTFRFNADYDVTEKLKVAGGINYINSGSNNRALMGGYNTNVIRALINTPTNFDITNGLDRPYDNPDSYLLTPTVARPWGDSRSYANGRGWDSPYWSLNMNPQKDENNRFLGFVEGNYTILPWLTSTVRYGIDSYQDVRKGGFSRGTSGVVAGTINDVIYTRRDYNTDVILTANRDLNRDLNLNVIVGHNYYNSYRNQISTRGDGLIVPGNFNISNASTTVTFNNTHRRELAAGYADVRLGYKKWLFVEVTGRNEWTSTLAKGKNSFFYPSVGSSFIFSDAFKIKSPVLTYGKVRGSYAQVGNDADPYSLTTYYNTTSTSGWIQSSIAFPFTSQAGLSNANNVGDIRYVQGNPDLKPERISTWEIGTDLGFFRNRAALDVVYYNNVSRDQILPQSIPASTGFAYTLINGGEISNQGIEAALRVTPVKSKSITWNSSVIYSKNVSKVISVAPGAQNVSFGGVFVDTRAQVGDAYGTFYAIDVKRNDKGEIVIDDNPFLADGVTPNPNYGYPIVNSAATKVGDPNPKFNLGWRNEFNFDLKKYGDINLSFLFDVRYGFDIFNAPRLQMVFNGVDASTENRGENYVFDGVKNSDGTQNDLGVVIGQSWYRRTFDIPGLYVEKDLYWLRLRDVNLTYTLPEKFVKSIGLSKASLTFTARNFLLATNYTGSDPDLGTRQGQANYSGIDFWTTPNTRSIGTALNIVF
jgi:TonB-linked SusC/RagA family outer membrane protein